MKIKVNILAKKLYFFGIHLIMNSIKMSVSVESHQPSQVSLEFCYFLCYFFGHDLLNKFEYGFNTYRDHYLLS